MLRGNENLSGNEILAARKFLVDSEILRGNERLVDVVDHLLLASVQTMMRQAEDAHEPAPFNTSYANE